MTRFHSLPFLRQHAGAALDPVETGSPLPQRVPLVLFIAFLLMLAVGAVAPAWATPDQSPHNQTVPTPVPTPTSGPALPTARPPITPGAASGTGTPPPEAAPGTPTPRPVTPGGAPSTPPPPPPAPGK